MAVVAADSARASYNCREKEGLTVGKPNGITTGIISGVEVEHAYTVVKRLKERAFLTSKEACGQKAAQG
jgi:hypothetical protein